MSDAFGTLETRGKSLEAGGKSDCASLESSTGNSFLSRAKNAGFKFFYGNLFFDTIKLYLENSVRNLLKDLVRS